jgi:hypothetical protein
LLSACAVRLLVVLIVLTASPALLRADDCIPLYAEPTLGVASLTHLSGDSLNDDTFLLNRAAFGALLGRCAHPRWGAQVRFGGTFVLAGGRGSAGPFGVGLEAQLDAPLSDNFRLGARVGLEYHGVFSTYDSALVPMAGLRLRINEQVVVAADALYVRYDNYFGRSTAAGGMIGLSIDGRAGAAVAGVDTMTIATVALGLIVFGFLGALDD